MSMCKIKSTFTGITVLVIISVYILCGCQNTRDISVDNANYSEDTEFVGEETTFDISVSNSSQIQQWALDNDGSFTAFLYDAGSWAFDTKRAVEDVDINYSEARSIFSPVRSALVAVIDTDIDTSNSAIAQSIWQNRDEVASDGLDNDNNGFIDDVAGWNFCNNSNILMDPSSNNSVHGTHIVGCLCGYDEKTGFSGVLAQTNIKVMCLKALDGSKEEGSINNVVSAIKYAENNGANICCLSFASYKYSDLLYSVMNKSEMLFVVSAGNDGVSLTNGLSVYPASYKLKNMISVADLRSDGNLSYTSNYGSNDVDIAAPGTDIVSTLPNDKYGFLCGTSCAVPYVAGAAALIYCQSGDLLSAEEIKGAIMHNAKELNTLKGKIISDGMIDLYASLRFVS